MRHTDQTEAQKQRALADAQAKRDRRRKRDAKHTRAAIDTVRWDKQLCARRAAWACRSVKAILHPGFTARVES